MLSKLRVTNRAFVYLYILHFDLIWLKQDRSISNLDLYLAVNKFQNISSLSVIGNITSFEADIMLRYTLSLHSSLKDIFTCHKDNTLFRLSYKAILSSLLSKHLPKLNLGVTKVRVAFVPTEDEVTCICKTDLCNLVLDLPGTVIATDGPSASNGRFYIGFL